MSQTGHQGRRSGRFVPAVIFGSAAFYALDYTGPLITYGGYNPLAVFAWGVLLLSLLTIFVCLIQFMAERALYERATTPTGLKGDAGFSDFIDIEHEVILDGWGPYWGSCNGRAVFIDYESNAVTIGTAGSGKDTRVLQSSIVSNPYSKTVVDFKGTSACILARMLRERDETVPILNFGDLWTDLLGPSACYNPLHLIADLLWRNKNGILDVSAECAELAMQLLPEPSGGDTNGNGHFRTGSRNIIEFAIQIAVLVYGYDATLGHVLEVLNDRDLLLRYALWASGRLEVEGQDKLAALPIHESPWVDRHDPIHLSNYTSDLRNLGDSIANLLEDSGGRAYENFVVGAQNALKGFGQATRASAITSKSTFRFADQKEGDAPVTVFLVADPSRMEAQSKILGIVQWCMLQEWKRHANKSHPVYLYANEATNFKINGADSLQTWGREFGIRIHWFLQSLSAYRKVYGKEAVNTLLSETEIKQFLPGQRDPETLKLIEEMLGQQSVVMASYRGNNYTPLHALDGYDLREDTGALLPAEEIRRLAGKGILFVRQNRALLTDLPSIAAIHPYREQIDDNPMFGKPYLLPVQLRIAQGPRPPLKQ